MIRVLMIEDNPEFAQLLGQCLKPYNIIITNYEDPYLGLNCKITDYDVLVLDLTLPGMDGLEVCERISKNYDIPIIISSARSDVTDKIMGLQTGADYYLPKPYDSQEMYAVIQSLLRRSKKKTNDTIKHDEASSQIFFQDKALSLTQGEYEVMLCLTKNKNAIVSREQIVEQCESISESNSKSIDVIIGRLRTKIGDKPKNSNYIHSIRGLGYKLSQ
jgi:two-component system OmpR family response regulator